MADAAVEKMAKQRSVDPYGHRFVVIRHHNDDGSVDGFRGEKATAR